MVSTHIGKSSRLFILLLVIQDHIESIGKPILLKGDEVLLNGLLAQMLSGIAPNPSTTFSFQICQNPKLQLGPTNSFYPAPPSSYDIATARNPNSSVTLIRISVSPRWPCQFFVACCNYFGLIEIAIGLIEMACQLSVALLLHFGSTELMQSVVELSWQMS